MARPKSNDLKLPDWFITTAIVFVFWGAVLAVLAVLAFKPIPIFSTAELDIKIVALALKESRAHCKEIRAKNYMIDTSGLNVKAGCVRQ